MTVVTTIAGRLTSDPSLRFTNSGDAVASFTVARNDRKFDKQTNQWVDGDTLFLDVSCWRALAEGAAETLTKGDQVIVLGKLKQRSYDAKDGSKRTVIELVAEEIGKGVRARKTSGGFVPSNVGEQPEW